MWLHSDAFTVTVYGLEYAASHCSTRSQEDLMWRILDRKNNTTT